MAMGWVFLGTHLASSLMRRGLILINGFGEFSKNPGRIRVLPHQPRPVPIIYKIKFLIKFNFKFKIKLIYFLFYYF